MYPIICAYRTAGFIHLALRAGGNQRIKLDELPVVLEQPLQFVSEACANLKWSLEFHKNCLFGEHSGSGSNDGRYIQVYLEEGIASCCVTVITEMVVTTVIRDSCIESIYSVIYNNYYFTVF